MRTRTLFSAVFLGLLLGCGPMNSPKKINSDDQNKKKSSPTASGATRVSKNNQFYVYATPVNPSASNIPSSTRLEIGENTYLFRFSHCEDLKNPSDQATLKITYWMPEMPDMGKSDGVAVRQTDGSYTSTLFFGMPGHWEITLKMQDGNIQDDYVFDENF